jgi:hypothetical protein
MQLLSQRWRRCGVDGFRDLESGDSAALFRKQRASARTRVVEPSMCGEGQFVHVGETFGAGARSVEQKRSLVFAPDARYLLLFDRFRQESWIRLGIAASGRGAE